MKKILYSLRSRINWFERTVELVVVFIGLSAALLLSTWNDNNKDRALEAQYLNNFYAEIKADSTNLSRSIAAGEVKLERLERFVNILTETELPFDSSNAVFIDMLALATIKSRSTTYETIKFGGDIDIITDFDLKQELIEYYIKYEGLAVVQEVQNAFVNTYIVPFAMEEMDMLKGQLKLPEIAKTIQFKNLLAGMYSLNFQDIAYLKETAEVNSSLLKKLAKIVTLQPVLSETTAEFPADSLSN